MNRTVAIGVLAALTLSACVIAPAGRPYVAYDRQPVYVAPPPPRVEYVGVPPVAGQVWIQGFWNWAGDRHQWVPGYWENPRSGYRWVPHTWERNGDRWHQNGGRWEEHGDHDHHGRDRRNW